LTEDWQEANEKLRERLGALAYLIHQTGD